jgi:hypothetical protein
LPNDRTAHPPGIAPTRRCSSVALTSGVDVRRLDLLYLLTLSLTVALGLRYLGVLLMGSLLIIPPAAARVLARNLKEMLVLSAAIAIVSTVSGSYIAALTGRATGPTIVIIAASIFFATSIRGRGMGNGSSNVRQVFPVCFPGPLSPVARPPLRVHVPRPPFAVPRGDHQHGTGSGQQ